MATFIIKTLGTRGIQGAKGNTGDVTLEAIAAKQAAEAAAALAIEAAETAIVPLADLATLNVAYVSTDGNDTTAIVGRQDKRFATINAALTAMPNGGNIVIGRGRFIKVDTPLIKNNHNFIGSGMPVVNSDNTGLQDGTGTIIEGPFIGLNTSNNICRDFGVDSGYEVCNRLYGGAAQEGFMLTNISGPSYGTGILVENIIAICKDKTSQFHACLIEKVDGAYVNNIKTYFGVHGFVTKAINSNISNIKSVGATNGMIIKASSYAKCYNNNYSNISLGDDTIGGGGLLLQSESGENLNSNNIKNVNMQNTDYGIKFVAVNTISLNNISDIVIEDCLGEVLEFTGAVIQNQINNLQSLNCKSNGVLFSPETDANRFVNINIITSVAVNLGSGMFVAGNRNEFINITLSGFKYGGIDFDHTIQILDNFRIHSNGSYDLKNYEKLIINGVTSPENATLQNSFTNHDIANPSSYVRYWTENTTTHIEGHVTGGAANEVVFVLPPSKRPLSDKKFTVRTNSGSITVDILPTGEVQIGAGSYTVIYFDGINFKDVN
jgi:hypothetical protein